MVIVPQVLGWVTQFEIKGINLKIDGNITGGLCHGYHLHMAQSSKPGTCYSSYMPHVVQQNCFVLLDEMLLFSRIQNLMIFSFLTKLNFQRNGINDIVLFW